MGTALGVALFGLAVIAGYLAPRPPAWLVPQPGAPAIAFSTAAGFVCAGIALFASAQQGPQWARVRFAATLVLTLLAGAAVFQIATSIPLGIDLPELHRALTPRSCCVGCERATGARWCSPWTWRKSTRSCARSWTGSP